MRDSFITVHDKLLRLINNGNFSKLQSCTYVTFETYGFREVHYSLTLRLLVRLGGSLTVTVA